MAQWFSFLALGHSINSILRRTCFTTFRASKGEDQSVHWLEPSLSAWGFFGLYAFIEKTLKVSVIQKIHTDCSIPSLVGEIQRGFLATSVIHVSSITVGLLSHLLGKSQLLFADKPIFFLQFYQHLRLPVCIISEIFFKSNYKSNHNFTNFLCSLFFNGIFYNILFLLPLVSLSVAGCILKVLVDWRPRRKSCYWHIRLMKKLSQGDFRWTGTLPWSWPP